jgi:hypothetical protein
VTAKGVLLPGDALGHLPDGLRKELLGAYNEIVGQYRRGKWEPAELNGGKLCEVVYSILRGYVDGAYPARSRKPRNMVDDCNALAGAPKAVARSVRIGIPRVLVALYEIRNNRNVGHVGGDVDPNHMDGAVVVGMAKWVLAELIRLLHDVDVAEATGVVEALTDREVPIVWETGAIKRVLDPGMSASDSTLVLLYHTGRAEVVRDLLAWTEYGNSTRYRTEVLRALHRGRLVEFDRTSDTVQLTSRGAVEVEARLLARPAA